MNPARANLEDLVSQLRARKLDRTLTRLPGTVSPARSGDASEYVTASTGITPLDVRLGGGFPRGQLSELVGARSSGRTSLLLRMLAAATARHELVACIDALDMLDVASAEAAGIDLDRLLWVRGFVVPNPGLSRDVNARALDQALKALTLVLQAGNFGIVALDVAEAPPGALQHWPFTTWLRLQRIIEGSQTVCLLVGQAPMARSAAGLTLKLSGAPGTATGQAPAAPLFAGLDFDLQVIRARPPMRDDTRLKLTTYASNYEAVTYQRIRETKPVG